MLYISTRGAADGKTFADIAFEGFARDGGLYVPENYPKFSSEDLALLRGRDFPSVALEVLRRFWTQIPVPDLWGLCRDAWQPSNFGNGRDPFKAHDVAPIKWLHDGVGLYELSNGPTLTFDDFSLQFLKRLHAKHLGTEPENITLLGATTGDMGASAEYAFGDRKDTRVVMLSPKDRMSKFQSAQLYSNRTFSTSRSRGLSTTARNWSTSSSRMRNSARPTSSAPSTPTSGRESPSRWPATSTPTSRRWALRTNRWSSAFRAATSATPLRATLRARWGFRS